MLSSQSNGVAKVGKNGGAGLDKKIKILKKGPYEVSGGVPMQEAKIQADEHNVSEEWLHGPSYPGTDKTYYLCRCGHSENKPFCDGAHAKAGFAGEENGEKKPYRERCKVYEGAFLNLLDDENLCCSVRFCDRGVGVWTAAIESYTEEKRALAIEECAQCASGRLTVLDKKTGEAIEPELEKEICPIQDTPADCLGPLWVKGGIPLEGADGKPYETRNRMTLCRCGKSVNMPFCDISHRNCRHMQGLEEGALEKSQK